MKPDSHPPGDAPAPPLYAGRCRCPPSVIPTESLFRGAQEILIDHLGEHYRLRITKNGKLILTK